MTGDGRPNRAAPGDPRGMIREMAFHDTPADTRRRARGGWPIRVFRLGEEPPDDLSGRTTAEERVAMMWPLAVDAWTTSGRGLPQYPRHQMPGRVIRGSGSGPRER